MCGRFLIKADGKHLARLFDLEAPVDVVPRFDVRPGESVLTIRRAHGGRNRAFGATWGFILERDGKRQTLINARSETAPEKPTFKGPAASGRVIVPADGWYEWFKDGGTKGVPYRVEPQNGLPLAFAGLWRPRRRQVGDFVADEAPDGEVVVMTTAASPGLGWLHDRMPAVVPLENVAAWLDPRVVRADAVRALLADPAEVLAEATRVDGPLAAGPDARVREAETARNSFELEHCSESAAMDLTGRKRAR